MSIKITLPNGTIIEAPDASLAAQMLRIMGGQGEEAKKVEVAPWMKPARFIYSGPVLIDKKKPASPKKATRRTNDGAVLVRGLEEADAALVRASKANYNQKRTAATAYRTYNALLALSKCGKPGGMSSKALTRLAGLTGASHAKRELEAEKVPARAMASLSYVIHWAMVQYVGEDQLRKLGGMDAILRPVRKPGGTRWLPGNNIEITIANTTTPTV